MVALPRGSLGPVVLAIDGTERDGDVVVTARTIAARLDVPLEVITVIEPGLPMPDDSQSLTSAIDDARRHTRETIVTDFVCRFSGGATPARVHVRFGSAAHEIDRFARDVVATVVLRTSADAVGVPNE